MVGACCSSMKRIRPARKKGCVGGGVEVVRVRRCQEVRDEVNEEEDGLESDNETRFTYWAWDPVLKLLDGYQNLGYFRGESNGRT